MIVSLWLTVNGGQPTWQMSLPLEFFRTMLGVTFVTTTGQTELSDATPGCHCAVVGTEQLPPDVK